MVVAADLAYDRNGNVVVGKETARVCRKAAEIARIHPDALVCATAGYSPKYKVDMGSGPMRRELQALGISPDRIRTPVAREFNTNGEMEIFVETMEIETLWIDNYDVFLVARWPHMFRSWLLLRATLGENLWVLSRVQCVFVPSWWLFGFFYEPLALAKNWKNIRRAFF